MLKPERIRSDSSKRAFDLEDRLLEFAVRICELVENLPASRLGKHISNQILRSGTSPAPNYGEAQSAESRKDFIHKLKICLKELRETQVWLRLIKKKKMNVQIDLDSIISEADELIAIFVKSVQTSELNRK